MIFSLGGTQILLQGGLHPDKPFEWYEEMIRFMKSTGIHIHGFSPPEVCHFTELSGLSKKEVLQRLIAAGLDSIPGGGAEILSDRVRDALAPRKCSADEWIEVMEEAHKLGLRTTATMMFGHVETMEERLEHLDHLRDLQDRTAGFTAFIPWPFQPDNTPLAESVDIKKTTGFEYLRMLALSRIYLDNFDSIQASWVTPAGVHFRLTEEEIKRLVSAAGFEPRQRLMDYTLV